MNNRDTMLSLIDGAASPDYIPAAFFLHFDSSFHRGQPAIDKHLQFFRSTGMDFVEIQYEQPFPASAPIRKPEDWAHAPLCSEEFFEEPIHVVEGLVKAAKSGDVSDMFGRPFMGGMERKGVLATGNSEEIRQAATDVLALSPERFILAADCTVPSDTPWENLRTAIETAHQHRKHQILSPK